MIRALQTFGVSALICAGAVFVHCAAKWIRCALGSRVGGGYVSESVPEKPIQSAISKNKPCDEIFDPGAK